MHTQASPAKAASAAQVQSFDRIPCAQCPEGAARYPLFAGRARYCAPCWETHRQEILKDQPPVKIRRMHGNALASEYDLSRGSEKAGRLIVFRDSMTVCVRYFTLLNGASEVVLEEALGSLLGNTHPQYLNVLSFPVRDGNEAASREGKRD